jgi:hypothetical protein
MFCVANFKTCNPILIGGALLANVAARAMQLALIGVAAPLYAALCAALFTLYVIGAYAIANAKVIALCVAVIGTVALCAAMPQVAVGALLVLVYAEVTKK